MHRTRQIHLTWLTCIILLATGLAGRLLAYDVLFYDEYWSIFNSGGTFGPLGVVGIWERTATVDPGGMGVLYHWLLGSWQLMIGNTPFSVRVFSLLVGVLAISAIYRLGATLFNPQTGLYSATILASSAFFIDYMHEARAYTLLIVFAIGAIYCYWRIVAYESAHWLFWLGLALMLSALAYTHYVALTIGIVLGIYHLTQYTHTRKWWLVILTMAISGLLFLPWLNITLEVVQRGLEDTVRQANSMNARQILDNLAQTFSNANLALLVLTGGLALTNINRRSALIWTWLLVSLLLVITVNYVIPFMVHLRYVMFILPAIVLIVALGMTRAKSLSLALLVTWAGAGLYQSLKPQFIDQQFGQIYRTPAMGFEMTLATLNQRASDNDLVLFHVMPPDFESFFYYPLNYYFVETNHVIPVVMIEQYERMNNTFASGDVDYFNKDVKPTLANVDFIWSAIVPKLERTQRFDVVNTVLATQYAHCETVFARPDMILDLYARMPQTDPLATYGDDPIALYDLQHGISHNEQVTVVLGWQAHNIPYDTYAIGLYIVDEAGTPVLQHDFSLPNERPFTCTSTTFDVRVLPTGTYQLQALVYETQSGDRLLTNTNSDYILLRIIHHE